MERLIYILHSCSFIILISSCSLQKDFVPLNKEKLEIVNQTIDSKCLNSFDNTVLITALKKHKFNYIFENDQVYVEKEVMDDKEFFNDINRSIQEDLIDESIPKGYLLFKYRRLNVRLNEYETRPLDKLDKTLLPDIIKRNGFKYIFKNDCLYVERELIDNQDFLSKAISMLDFERGEGPNPYPPPYLD